MTTRDLENQIDQLLLTINTTLTEGEQLHLLEYMNDRSWKAREDLMDYLDWKERDDDY